MKNSINILCLIFFTLVISSCEKKIINDTQTFNPLSSALEQMNFPSEQADFTLVVTSSKGISVYPNGSASAVVAVEAYSKQNTNIGNLSINTISIPFKEQKYFWSPDSSQSANLLLNKNLSIKLEGQTFPSFSTSEFSPNVTNYTINGLENKKINRNSGISYELINNDGSQNMNYYLVVCGSNEQSSHTYNEQLGVNPLEININSQILSEFADYDKIKIFIVKGVNKRLEIEGKTRDIRFLSHSYTTYYFNE